jgi:hypothetical protein
MTAARLKAPRPPGPDYWKEFRTGFRDASLIVKILAIIGILVIVVPLLGCLILPLAALFEK